MSSFQNGNSVHTADAWVVRMGLPGNELMRTKILEVGFLCVESQNFLIASWRRFCTTLAFLGGGDKDTGVNVSVSLREKCFQLLRLNKDFSISNRTRDTYVWLRRISAHMHQTPDWDIFDFTLVRCICCAVLGHTEWDVLQQVLHVCSKQQMWLMALLEHTAADTSPPHRVRSFLTHMRQDKYRLSGQTCVVHHKLWHEQKLESF